MRVLVTGANGFIGKNLCSELMNHPDIEILKFCSDTPNEDLKELTKNIDFIYHLAGINRPKDPSDFKKGNANLTLQLLDYLRLNETNCPVLFTSSVQADRDNPYGNSKRDAETHLRDFSETSKSKVMIYRLPNVFGKWCKPNYNSVVATFCHNIARQLPITVSDPSTPITLAYIDDVVSEFVRALDGNENKVTPFCEVPVTHPTTLGEIVDRLHSFNESRQSLMTPNMSDLLTKKLYSTYLSYLPEGEFSYKLKMNTDNRGSFTEFLKSEDRGQVSVNISKPGITKGNHWHHTKVEKFLVVCGTGIIRFRNILSKEIIEYRVSGDELEVIDIPVGYTHNIENTGSNDLITVMWANESFDKNNPDTFFLGV